MADLTFPDGFLWGTATSSYQHEGGNHNDWSEWELSARTKVDDQATSGLAADYWSRFQTDFAYLSELNFGVYRFSIEWSRIEPNQGVYDEAALAHYDAMVAELLRRGIKPMITLHHYTNPIWVSKSGGWQNTATIALFCRFAMMIVERYGSSITLWLTVNEPTIEASLAYMYGVWPPGKKNPLATLRVLNNLLRAHNHLYVDIHQLYQQKGWPRPAVSFAHHMFDMVPATPTLINRLITKLYLAFTNDYSLRRTKNKLDFLALNYYFHKELRFKLGGSGGVFDEINSGGPTSDLGWELYPQGIYNLCQSLRRYRLPIYITENGLADKTDTKRAQFIVSHAAQIHRAIQAGIDIRGYIYWSFLDGFEWEHGYRGRYGLIAVDFATLQRTIRHSALVYAKIAKSNSIPEHLQHEYLT